MSTTTTAFGGLSIRSDDRVLRPRAWTEAQSRWAAELATTAPAGPALELCTGAGHIGLLLAAVTDRSVVAVDLDAHAAEVARGNARATGLADRFAVRVGDLADVLGPDERFGLVLADPPWVPRADTDRYPEDPLMAIDGGTDGLDVARQCLAVAARHLLPTGALVLQVGTLAQAGVVESELPDGLDVRELRAYDRGVLVHLERR